VRLDDPLDDLESEPRAAAPGLVRLPEAIEDVRQLLAGDSRASVLHPEEHTRIPQRRSCGDSATRLRELRGVANQVLEHLENPIAIGPHIRKARPHVNLKSTRVDRLRAEHDRRSDGDSAQQLGPGGGGDRRRRAAAAVGPLNNYSNLHCEHRCGIGIHENPLESPPAPMRRSHLSTAQRLLPAHP